MIRLRLTAPLVVALDQPKSSSSGISNAPVEERKPAAAISAAIVTAATHQAGWIRLVVVGVSVGGRHRRV